MTEQATPKWHEDLRNWSRTYRGVGSVEKADLIDKALVALAEGRTERVRRALHRQVDALLQKAVRLSRGVEAEFGRDDDRTIFAKNANCELYELRNMLASGEAKDEP